MHVREDGTDTIDDFKKKVNTLLQKMSSTGASKIEWSLSFSLAACADLAEIRAMTLKEGLVSMTTNTSLIPEGTPPNCQITRDGTHSSYRSSRNRLSDQFSLSGNTKEYVGLMNVSQEMIGGSRTYSCLGMGRFTPNPIIHISAAPLEQQVGDITYRVLISPAQTHLLAFAQTDPIYNRLDAGNTVFEFTNLSDIDNNRAKVGAFADATNPTVGTVDLTWSGNRSPYPADGSARDFLVIDGLTPVIYKCLLLLFLLPSPLKHIPATRFLSVKGDHGALYLQLSKAALAAGYSALGLSVMDSLVNNLFQLKIKDKKIAEFSNDPKGVYTTPSGFEISHIGVRYNNVSFGILPDPSDLDETGRRELKGFFLNLASQLSTRPNDEYDIYNLYTQFRQTFNETRCPALSSKSEFHFLVNDINVILRKDLKNGYAFINNVRINLCDLDAVMAQALCMHSQAIFDSLVADVHKRSLNVRKAITEGLPCVVFTQERILQTLPAEVADDFRYTSHNAEIAFVKYSPRLKFMADGVNYYLDFPGVGRKYVNICQVVDVLVASAANYAAYSCCKLDNIRERIVNAINGAEPAKEIKVPEGVTKINTITLGQLYTVLVAQQVEVSKEILKSKEFLKQAVEATGAQKTTIELSGRAEPCYLITGTLRKYALLFDGKVYDAESKRYICIVDSKKKGVGYDHLVTRLFALKNDNTAVTHIATLNK